MLLSWYPCRCKDENGGPGAFNLVIYKPLWECNKVWPSDLELVSALIHHHLEVKRKEPGKEARLNGAICGYWNAEDEAAFLLWFAKPR
jgi:hypothetical protein